jgi:hypothetical protein
MPLYASLQPALLLFPTRSNPPFHLIPIHLLRNAVVNARARVGPLRAVRGEQRAAVVAVAVEVLVAVGGPTCHTRVVSSGVTRLSPSISPGGRGNWKEKGNEKGKEGNDIPSPRVKRPARSIRVNVRNDVDARRERALAAVLLPPDVVVRGHSALVVRGRLFAVLRVGAGRVVLQLDARYQFRLLLSTDDVGPGECEVISERRRTKM